MRIVKRYVSCDNKEFKTKEECLQYEQKIQDDIADLFFRLKCSECQMYSLCKYLTDKGLCQSLCDFMIEKIQEEF